MRNSPPPNQARPKTIWVFRVARRIRARRASPAAKTRDPDRREKFFRKTYFLDEEFVLDKVLRVCVLWIRRQKRELLGDGKISKS